jgi:hypothetical protein
MAAQASQRFSLITDQSVAGLRKLIGVVIEDTLEPWCHEATRDNIRHWAHGIGDAGFLRHIEVQIRRHNPVGDTIYINGEVKRVFADSGAHCAEIEQTAVQQDGELSVRAKAIVRLPSRA